jgi:hypothetical protein
MPGCLASGDVDAGYGIDNSAALHFEGLKLVNVLTSDRMHMLIKLR